MSINNSYFSKNNTIISNSFTNTGRNPVMELFYGTTVASQYPSGYSRFIFNLDLSLLLEKITFEQLESLKRSALACPVAQSLDPSVKQTVEW